jgi:hypothetical protein
MPKSFEQVLDSLDDESKAAITAQIDSERTKGVESTRKKSAEVQKHLTELNRLRDLLKSVEIDTDSDIEAQIKDRFVKKGQEGESEWKKENAKLQKQIKEVSDKLVAADKQKSDLMRSSVITKVASALKDKAYAHEDIALRLYSEGRVTIGSDGSTIIYKDGDNEIDLEKGMGDYLKSRPEIAINSQKPGSGSPPPSSGPNKKTIARDTFFTMEPQEQAQWFKDGNKVTD